MSLGVSTPLFGAKTPRPAEHKDIGTGSKDFASGSLGVLGSGATAISTPELFHLWILALRETAYISGADSEHIYPSREPCPGPARYRHLPDTLTESSKDHSTILSSHWLSGWWGTCKTSERGSIAALLLL